jgi:hypothetical protein
VLVLLRGLPLDEAATWREDREKHPDWSQTDELLASLLELTDAWSRAIVKVLGGKPRGSALKVPRPEAPQSTPEKKEIETDPAVIAAWFRRHVR